MNYLILDPSEIEGDQAVVRDPRKIKHLRSVIDVAAGTRLKVGELGGLLGTAVVKAVGDCAIELESLQLERASPAKLPITLVIAMPRPKALRRLLLHATAMGIGAIHVIHSYRVEKSYWQSPVLNRIQEFLLEGLEQSGDTILPEVTISKRFKPFVQDELPAIIKGKRVFLAHPGHSERLPRDLTLDQEVVFIVGAEGGFICYEVELLKEQGCQQASLGERILHSETAVSMMVGQIMSHQYLSQAPA